MVIEVRGIESGEGFGSILIVVDEWCFIVCDPDMSIPGFRMVPLKGRGPPRYDVHPFKPSKSRELIAVGSSLS